MWYCLILSAGDQPGHPNDSLGSQSLHLVGDGEDWAYTQSQVMLYFLAGYHRVVESMPQIEGPLNM